MKKLLCLSLVLPFFCTAQQIDFGKNGTFPNSSITGCNTISLPDTMVVCFDSSTILNPIISGSDTITSILWTPATGLSADNVLRPTIAAGSTSGWRYVTINFAVSDTNLVVNGDFSAGNTGFTSSYGYVAGSGSIAPPAVYAVDNNPQHNDGSAMSFGDHTTGTGLMMSINGATAYISLWCETVSVSPYTYYEFTTWVANWSPWDVTGYFPELQFAINGLSVGGIDTISSPESVWVRMNSIWYSDTNTIANICINDESIAYYGNDLSLDDISFRKICRSIDSTYVQYIPKCVSTGIENNKGFKENFATYPNPAFDNITISSNVEKATFKILTPTGKCIYQGTLATGSNTIDVRNILSGMYLIEIVGNDGDKTVHIITKE